MQIGLIERLSRDAVLIKASSIRGGSEAISKNFPNAPGIYVFYKDIERYSGVSVADHLIGEVEASKFFPREGVVSPLFNVKVESLTRLTKRKTDALKEFSKNIKFSESVDEIISLSILFQTPLYIGKAKDLKSRVRQHFDGDSDLKEVLASSGIDIRRTTILAIVSDEDSVFFEEEKNTGIEYENLMEDLLSRMFCPGFTRRYG